MPATLALLQKEAPRHKTVQLRLDLNPQNSTPYLVASYYKERMYRGIVFSDAKSAFAELDDEALRPGPGGDSSWNAVLARCQGREEAPTPWDGSSAEYAARFADIGTWEWLLVLMAHRKVVDTVLLALKNNNNKEGAYATKPGGDPPRAQH